QVVAGERDDIGSPALQKTKILPMILDLQIDQPDLVPCPEQRLRDELQPERLESEKHLCVHQGSGMDAEHPHVRLLRAIHPFRARARRAPQGSEAPHKFSTAGARVLKAGRCRMTQDWAKLAADLERLLKL